MGTYHRITIENPGKLTAEKIEERLWESVDGVDDHRQATPYRAANPNGPLVVTASTKWLDEDSIGEQCRKWSRKAGRRVEWFAEWDTRDADEPGAQLVVFEAGTRRSDEGAVSGMVPMNLAALVLAVRDRLTAEHDDGRGGCACDGCAISAAAAALCDALLPTPAPTLDGVSR